MALVLIVEDEPVLRSSMARGIAKLPGVEVIDAGNFVDAVALIEQAPVDLLISDIDLPDGTGLELLDVAARKSDRIQVVYVSAYADQYSDQVPQRAGVAVYEKPLPLEQLRRIVTERLGLVAEEVAATPFTVLDYVQLACMTRRSVAIEVPGPHGQPGQIVIHQGEVWRAADDRGGGEPAFLRLVTPSTQGVVCRTLTGPPPQRNVLRPSFGIILDAVVAREPLPAPPVPAELEMASADDFDRNRTPTADYPDLVRDELSALSAQDDPDPFAIPGKSASGGFVRHASDGVGTANAQSRPTVPDVTALPRVDPVQLQFDALRDQALEAMLARDYETAFRIFQSANELRADDPSVVANLKRLQTLLDRGEP